MFRADAVMLFFVIPVVDCLRLILVRVVRNGSLFVGDRNHLHHILQRLLPEGASLIAYWTIVGVPSLLMLVFPKSTPWWVALSLAAYVFALVKNAVDRRQGIARAHAHSAGWEHRFSIGESDG